MRRRQSESDKKEGGIDRYKYNDGSKKKREWRVQASSTSQHDGLGRDGERGMRMQCKKRGLALISEMFWREETEHGERVCALASCWRQWRRDGVHAVTVVAVAVGVLAWSKTISIAASPAVTPKPATPIAPKVAANS